ncbi:MAG: asparagine synthase (glutamine-hydrolyzing) [bacterium]
MCGIAGVIDPNLNEKEKVIGDMVSSIIHRGPDDDGFFVDGYVGLGMRRLSIIDLSSGRQPITSADDRFLIFFNGEIYNYQSLRKELIEKGYKFKTQTDTEVILHMYSLYGEKMLPKLRGMFVFCIYDTQEKTVFLARDFFGIKPLYYLVQKTVSSPRDEASIVAFSSEIKSFLTYPGFIPQVNDSAVYNYLSFQYNPLTETFFKSVYKLPPAHWMKLDLKKSTAEIKQYWSFEFGEKKILPKKAELKENKGVDYDVEIDPIDPNKNRLVLPKTEEKVAEVVYETIKDSVSHHMIADVPVGSFLSGGVDSSIIATLMQEIRGDKKIKTFTVGFEGLTEGNESKETSDFLGTDHTEITVGADEYFNILPKAVWHFDEPVADPSAIGLYFVAREARKHVKVVLSGEGADEFFGGYNIYLEPFARKKILWIPKVILEFVTKIPFEFRGKNYARRASQRLKDWYIGNASIFKKDEIKKIWKGSPQNLQSLNLLYAHTAHLSESTQMQYIDIHTWLVGDILAKADKMTMANSLELRVPFLDTEIARLASVLPDTLKWNGGITKYILRKAFEKRIPETTRNRKKLGFPTPLRDWLTPERKDIYEKILSNEYISSHMDVQYIQKTISDHTEKKADNSRKIYLLLMLALWYNVYIKGEKISV